MEAPQPKPSRTEIANTDGACAEFTHGLNGPELKLLVFDPNPTGFQYVEIKLSYGKQTITQDMANNIGTAQLLTFDIRVGPPEAKRFGPDAVTSLLRLKRMNRGSQTGLFPKLLVGTPSEFEKYDPPPVVLPTKEELDEIIKVLEIQQGAIETAVNKSIPVAETGLLLGRIVQGISRGLEQKGVKDETPGPIVNRDFNPPPVQQLINILKNVETRTNIN